MSDSENSAGNEGEGLDNIVRTAALQGETKGVDAGDDTPASEYEVMPKDQYYGNNNDSKKGSNDKSPKNKRMQKKSANHSDIAALLAEDANDNNGKAGSRKLLAEYSLEEPNLSDRLASKGDERRHYGLPNAALVKIYYEDPETGQKWGYFERKPFYYPFAGAENKLALVGGSMEFGETPYETVCREIQEEISPEAAKIIIKSIDSNLRFVAIEHYDGVPIKNFVFEAKIKTREEWDKLVGSSMTADAGQKVIMPLEDIAATKEQWAFYHYDIEMKFQKDRLHYDLKWTKSPGIDFKEPWALFKSLDIPEVYNDSNKVSGNVKTMPFKPIVYDDSVIPKYAVQNFVSAITRVIF